MSRKFANRFFGDAPSDENDDGSVAEPLPVADEDTLDSDMVISDMKKPSSVNEDSVDLSLKPQSALKTAVFTAVKRRVSNKM